MKYLAIIESAGDGSYSAYVPDLPGCVACGDSVADVTRLIREGIVLHIESLREHGDPVPPPTSLAAEVEAA